MNFNAILTYFVQGNFDEQKIDVVLTYFMQRNFDERNIGVFPMYFFRPDFEGGKVKVVSVYFLMQFWCNFGALILMWFWKAKECGHFDISFW